MSISSLRGIRALVWRSRWGKNRCDSAHLYALVCGLYLGLAAPASALEGNSGVGVGGLMAGARPHLAVSPHAAIGLRLESGFTFRLDDTVSILLATNKDGVGLHNRAAGLLGYTTETLGLQIGPSVSFFSMAVCNAAAWCGRVSGISAGASLQINYYFLGSLGISLCAGGDWIAGRNLLLPPGLTGMFTVGPVLRWSLR